MKQLKQNTRYLLRSNVIQSNYKYNETMAKLIFDDGPVWNIFLTANINKFNT